MLQFIVGRAASGKTYETVVRAAECLKNGGTPVILVPEQFSFECEKQILKQLGEGASQKIGVFSFRRVYDEVNRITGGVCVEPLSDADRLILTKKAVKSVANELKVFGRYSGSDGFARKLCETISEFKTNAVSYEDLLCVSSSLDNTALKYKTEDIALIMRAYDVLVTERYIDPSDKLSLLYRKLEKYKFFENKTVFIDSFDGFTGQQYLIADRILSQSKDVFVTINCSYDERRKFSIFTNVLQFKNRLTEKARNHSVKVGEDIVLNHGRYKNESLSLVESYLYGEKTEKCALNGVTVCHADTVYDEAEFVARNIRKIVREQNARYRDFLIVARDTENYSDALKTSLSRNGIPCFIDERLPLSGTPVAAAVLSAADLLKSVGSEKIFRFYKSGIEVFTPEEIGTLENYVYIWNIEGNDWFKEWDMNPDGFVEGEPNKEKLANLNKLRLRAVMPIKEMRENAGKTAKEAVLAIMGILDRVDAANGFKAIFKAYKQKEETYYADAVRKSYDGVISVFNSIVAAVGDEEIKPAEFYEFLSSSIALETIGVIPQSLDEVTFGAADRIRPSRPEYVFIMGANAGVFPKSSVQSGVLSDSDRTVLANAGLSVPDKTLFDSVNEDYLVYTNVCCAEKELFISYSSFLADGSEGESSPFLSGLCESFDIKTVREPEILNDNNIPETKESAFSEYCRRYNGDKPSSDTVSAALKLNSEEISEFTEKPSFFVSKENVKKLLGDSIRMSPSKFDDFSRCRFMYFCKDALGIRSLQKSEFDVLQRGTLIHYVLQRAVEIHKKGLAFLSREEISKLVDGLIDEYLSSIAGFDIEKTPRFKYIVFSMSRSLKAVVEHLSDEFKNSDFEPVACELGIGADGDIPEITVPIDNFGKLRLVGKIDRLDKYNGYVRIVDYKSGSRKFKLPDILFGQNMQMLIYLYAVCRDENYGGEPAGILYMPSSRDKSGSASAKRMNGLICDEKDVFLAMDRSNSGEFVPKADKRNAESFVSKEDFKEIFGFIEKRLKYAGKSIFEGKINANPIDGIDSPACKYCEFKGICRIEDKDILKVAPAPKEEVLSEIERWEEDVE